MDYPGCVHGIDRRCELPHDGGELEGRKRAPPMEQGGKIFTFDFLEDDVRHGAGASVVEHAHGVRRADARRDARFAQETFPRLRVVLEGRTKDLDRNLAPHLLVVCAEDTPHASLAKQSSKMNFPEHAGSLRNAHAIDHRGELPGFFAQFAWRRRD
jgi:hypothetical protein